MVTLSSMLVLSIVSVATAKKPLTEEDCEGKLYLRLLARFWESKSFLVRVHQFVSLHKFETDVVTYIFMIPAFLAVYKVPYSCGSGHVKSTNSK